MHSSRLKTLVKVCLMSMFIMTTSCAYSVSKTASPTFSLAAGSYTTAQSVSIADTTSGATIYYTLDGSSPSSSSTRKEYSSAITISTTTTLKAIATATGYKSSSTTSATYTISTPTAATPVFSLAAGTYTGSQTLTITDSTSGATIYYTTDGSTPSASNGTAIASGASITIAKSETVEAIAVLTGYTNSAVKSATYTISTPTAATPVFSLAAGTYTGSQTLTITDSTSGATIYYTTDGSTPSASNGTAIASGASITIAKSETVEAIAVLTGYTNSAVKSATYTISTPTAATPVFSLTAGTYTGSQTLTITDSTSGATIYYTTDGSTPSASNGTAIASGASITIAKSETVEAIAVLTGYTNSAIASATYTISSTSTATTYACQSTSTNYPWGKLDYQTWTPNNSQSYAGTIANPGVATGSAFSARLIQAWGIDTSYARQTAVFELANGCRRAYQTSSFSAANVATIQAAITANPMTTDSKSYSTYVDPSYVTQTMIDNKTILYSTTQHFAFWYGVNTSAYSYTYVTNQSLTWANFITQAGEWMEEVWNQDNSILNDPMPYASSSSPKKINVYICGTGLPFLSSDTTDCGASTGSDMWVSALYLMYGSTTMTHEFTHAIQTFTGGFSGSVAVDGGPFHEASANWNSGTLSPTFENGFEWYTGNLEKGPIWSYSRYGAFPWVQYVYETDATRSLVWSIWQNNNRDSDGNSTEAPVEALVRLGTASGAFPNGYTSFGDFMGWYGARLVAMDFEDQKEFLDDFTYLQTTTRFAGLTATSETNTYDSWTERPLMEWGTHIIPLTVASSASTIQVQLTGAASANGAAWRFSIVGVDSSNNPTYSALGAVTGTSNATITMPVSSGLSYYLAVTATPTEYQELGWEGDNNPTPNTFPYSVTITGATPLQGAQNACTSYQSSWGSDAMDLNWNTNGNVGGATSCPAYD